MGALTCCLEPSRLRLCVESRHLGYHWFALLNAVSYLVLLIAVLYLNTREARQVAGRS